MAATNTKISDTESSSNPSVRNKKTYSVQEVAQMLQISKSKAYELCKMPNFKVIRLGRTVRISKASFDEWLDGLL